MSSVNAGSTYAWMAPVSPMRRPSGFDVPSADTGQVEPPPAMPTDHASDVDARRGIFKSSGGRVVTRSSGSRSKKRVKFDLSAAEPGLRRRKGDDEGVSADTPRKDAARDRIHTGQKDSNPTVAPRSERAASGVDAVWDGIQREIVNAVIFGREEVAPKQVLVDQPPQDAREIVNLPVMSMRTFLKQLKRGEIEQVCMITASEDLAS
ncbi:TPA: hypothetical protein N0F65_011741 [Lagenidium giganteum]|uniref:Uncharacterized protein n=1 Tax=Lagenidium giganteum TaxID=4803 RepID=A0AAV2YCP5_9STRA|nr:TPA: hypothetical protein N0F65_011741 [Lagenidium giganteum]